MEKIKKKLKIFYSMKLAIVVLLVLAGVCTVVSIIPQGKVESFYLTNYSPFLAKVILGAQLNKAFTCWWFVALSALLCINLLLCSVIQLPQLMKRYNASFKPESLYNVKESNFVGTATIKDEEKILNKLSFKKLESMDNGVYSVRNKIGIFGGWLCHIGMLIIIVGFAIGQVISVDEVVYGVPGETLQVGETGYEVTIDDFEVILRQDFTVDQYKAYLRFINPDGESKEGISMVNHPFEAFGYRLYQNSTGWANDVKIYRDGELIQEELLCAGESLQFEDLPVTIVLNKFFPDYYEDGHDHGPISKTPLLINPVTIFSIYYDQELLDMNKVGMDEEIRIDNYVVKFDNPQQYTLIQVLRDPTLVFVAFGGVIMLISLVLSFYIKTEECLIIRNGEGIEIYARSKKGKSLYTDKVKATIEEIIKE